MEWPFRIKFKNNDIEIYESITDKNKSKIFRITQNSKEEISDLDEKYFILQIARSYYFDRLAYPNGHHIIVLAYDGNKSVDEYKIDSFVRILDRHIYLLKHKTNKELSTLCLDLNDGCNYVELGNHYDVEGAILRIFYLKTMEKKRDKDIDISLLRKAINTFETIDKDFNLKHRPYTEELIKKLIERKPIFDD